MNATNTTALSRREMLFGAAALGLVAPLAAPRHAAAEDDEHDEDHVATLQHPVVGTWINGEHPWVEIMSFHGDGTSMLYNPWIPGAVGIGKPELPVFAFGIWEPTGERTMRGMHRLVWIDATVGVNAVFTYTGEVTADGTTWSGTWRAIAKDETGTVIDDQVGGVLATRMVFPADEATPTA